MKRILTLATMTALLATGANAAVTVGNGAAVATPEGITVKVIRIGVGVNPQGSNSNQPRDRVIFADTDGNPLYVSPEDAPGVSNCAGECTETWVPFTAADDAQPAGYWSIIERADGNRQWAFREQPMYRFREEMTAPKVKRKSSGDYDYTEVALAAENDGKELSAEEKKEAEEKRRAAAFRRAPTAEGHDVDGRYVMEILPDTWMPMPMGVTVMEFRPAPGYVFTNLDERSLYFFTGELKSVPKDGAWAPVEAGQAALPVGEFSVLSRPDGVFQWAYQGKPLFTFDGDREFGDANGRYENDDRFELAYVLRYFMPEGIQIQKSHTYGGLLVTSTGLPLYVRERGNGGVDAVLRGDRGRLGVGQSLGISTCDAKCEETWKPLLAPSDAQPTGYWGIYERPDGSKQWSYYGYAAYTYGGGQEMGSVEIYDDVNHFEVAGGQPNTGIPLHWRVAPP
jgi:predicted lipoprotein with Yx(FWY)xxD motif